MEPRGRSAGGCNAEGLGGKLEAVSGRKHHGVGGPLPRGSRGWPI